MDRGYIQITRGLRWGYWVEIIDGSNYRLDYNGRAARLYGSKWFSLTFDKAKAKGLRKLAKYNALLERERKAWKVSPDD